MRIHENCTRWEHETNDPSGIPSCLECRQGMVLVPSLHACMQNCPEEERQYSNTCVTKAHRQRLARSFYPGVCFCTIGDWGRERWAQRHVATGMRKCAEECQEYEKSFVLTTGDNIYGPGGDALWWKDYFISVYAHEEVQQMDWYLTLGNHDFDSGRTPADIRQGAAAVGLNVILPDPSYHRRTFKLPNEEHIDIVFLDTERWSSSQREWLNKTLALSTAAQLHVVGHHPLYSGGDQAVKRGSTMQGKGLLEILQQYNVSAYHCGHEHDIQHLAPPGQTHYLVSGGGSTFRDDGGNTPHTQFAAGGPGEIGMVWQCRSERNVNLRCSVIDSEGHVVYTTFIRPRHDKVSAAESLLDCSKLGMQELMLNGLPGCAGTPPQCMRAKSVSEAEAVCSSFAKGARLCSAAELAGGAAWFTGCGFDGAAVWTSTSCRQSNGNPGKLIVPGRQDHSEAPKPMCSGNSHNSHAVRCCYDHPVFSTLVAPKSYADITNSHRNCADLNWPTSNSIPSVCGGSRLRGLCKTASSQLQAARECSMVGARLCTSDELLADVTAYTGCGYDQTLVWTSTTCSGGEVLLIPGRSTQNSVIATCWEENRKSVAAVRCCADVADPNPNETPSSRHTSLGTMSKSFDTTVAASVSKSLVTASSKNTSESGVGSHDYKFSHKSCTSLGWRFRNGNTNVCGSSLQCTRSSYENAGKICSQIGARLCTTEELSADATAGSGCMFDLEYAWAQDECAMGASIAAGKSSNADRFPTKCRPKTDIYAVRCCADRNVQPQDSSVKPSLMASTIHGDVTLVKTSSKLTTISMGVVSSEGNGESRLRCSALMWPHRKGNRGVCSSSLSCKRLPHEEADQFCSTQGARLCTYAEIEADVTAGSGCMFDLEYVWTSGNCGGGKYDALPGKSSLISKLPPACLHHEQAIAVRCCADK